MISLTYPIGPDTPMFPGNDPPAIEQQSSIGRGDPANSVRISMLNHSGTHIDAPRHFWNDGPSLTDFEADAFVFDAPLLIDIPKGAGELITAGDLAPHAESFRTADLLILRTGYAGRERDTNPDRYASHSPGFTPDAADVLLGDGSGLRAIGLDTISAACPQHIEEGLEFHRRVLGTTGAARQLFIIEDLYLPAELHGARVTRVIVAPLMIRDADGAPCMVFAEVE